MKRFGYIDAATFENASKLLSNDEMHARVIAGGTDLIPLLKDGAYMTPPQFLVQLRNIPEANRICVEADKLCIGAMATLADIAASPTVLCHCPTLAQCADAIATPQIRNVGTIGGNLCQETQCWYYRYPERLGGPILCSRKDGNVCKAVTGDNRFHAVIGAKGCFSACQSDMAIILCALNASLILVGSGYQRNVPIRTFYSPIGNALLKGELIKEIRVPIAAEHVRACYLKHTLRGAVDFPLVSVGVCLTTLHGVCTDASIYIGAVSPMPHHAAAAEQQLIGRTLTDETISAAAERAMEGARPLAQNSYKVGLSMGIIKQALSSNGLQYIGSSL